MTPKLVSGLVLFAVSVFAADPAPAPVPPFTGSIERLDPTFDYLVPPDAKIEVLATGFNWSEGPVWKEDRLLFSDVPENTVFGWREGDKAAAEVLKPSGSLTGEGQGSNGLAVDSKGNLILCQHGERRIVRMGIDGRFTVLADQYQGKRFNSPNDLVIAKSGAIYFTDPPYGMPKGTQPDAPYHGVYGMHPSVPNSAVLLIDDLQWPNGIALSSNERILYVAVSDKDYPRIMTYDLTDIAASIGGKAIFKPKNGRVFFDARPLQQAGRKGSCDGMKVDMFGNVWATGPGGVLVLNKAGKHIGSILTGVPTGNCAFGGKLMDSLYITADMFLLRVKTIGKGA